VEPETLLLDEPLSNLDANLREEMRFEVRRLHDEYRYTTVYVTHDQSEAMTTADVIAVMNLGKIEQAGSPEDIYERPRSEFVARFIGSSNVIKGRRSTNPIFHTPGPPCDAPAAGSSRAAPARWRSASTSSGCGRRSPTHGERGAGNGGAAGFSGIGPRLSGGNAGPHPIARGRIGGREHSAGSRGLAPSAAGKLPCAERMRTSRQAITRSVRRRQ
jgi:hypothetical protein